MDKREYQEKLQEINRLIAAEDYEGAAQIADSIDWKRVRNVQTLVMISEVYEALERYEDSKVLLLRAYRRSPVGRTVLYRLVECCIKLRQFDQAIEYYSEYVQAAPHDNNKYILKYKIYRGRGSSLDEQIDILKDYLDQEYNEKWAYELARLQIQADHVQEGLATCDDLVLWFHSGKYVIKALELKKKYAPLTPKQQDIYDNRFNEQEDEEEFRPESYLSEASSLARSEQAEAAQEAIKSELAADISQTAKIEATKVELTRKAEAAQAQIERKAAEAEKALAAAPAAEAVEPVLPEDAGEPVLAEDAVQPVLAQAEDSASADSPEPDISSVFPEGTPAQQGKDDAAPEVSAEIPSMESASLPEGSLAKEIAAAFAQAPAEEDAMESAAEAEEETAEDTDPATVFVQEPETVPAAESAAERAEEEVRAAEEDAGEPAAGLAEEVRAVEEPEDAGEPAAERVQEPEEAVSPEQMQEEMIRNMREIVSGVGPQGQLSEDEAVIDEAIEQSKEDQENTVAARGSEMTFRVPVSEASQKRQAGRLTIDDILLSMGDGGDHIRMVTGGSVMSADEEAQIQAQQDTRTASSYAGTLQTDAEGYGAPRTEDLEEQTIPAAEEDRDPEIPRFLRDDVRQARQTTEIPAAEIAEADDALRAQMGLDSRDASVFAGEVPDTPQAAEPSLAQEITGIGPEMAEAKGQDADEAAAVAAAFMSEQKVPYTKEIAEAKTRRLPVEEIRKLHEAYLAENDAAAREAAKNAARAAERAAEMAEVEVAAEDQLPAGDEDVKIAPAPGTADGMPAQEAVSEESSPAGKEPREDAAEGARAPAAEADGQGPEPQAPAEGLAQDAARDAGAAALAGRIGEQVTRELPRSEPEPRQPSGRPLLKANQVELFRGFTQIGNLAEQIAGAIWQAEHRKDDRTSRTGNILILGAHGCGKTTIATGIAKAIAEDKGTHSVKMARIYAADLNRKDIAATIAKIAGGVLIVEEAGDLDDGIVDQLTTAMEFRTDGLIMILEDEQRYIHELLMRHPRFTMKFTAQIYIPEYSVEDLVNFGRIYAESKDYVISPEAAQACSDKIEAVRKGGEAVSVTNVIELVDRAIKSANSFFRRLGSAKKRYDEEDRIILKEKDFR